MVMNISWQQYIDKAWSKIESWIGDAIITLPNIVTGLLVLLLFIIISKVAKRLTAKTLARFSSHTQLNRLVSGSVSFLISGLGFVLALNIMHLEKTVMSLLAGVGVVGLALGFAFQDIAANFMSGLLILVRRPFRVGDIIESNNFFGRVEVISLRNTVVKMTTGQIVLIPNKEVFQNPLKNYSESGERRVDVSVGISYADDLEKAERVALEAIGPIALRDDRREIEFFYEEFGDSSINFVLRFWMQTVEQKSYLQARHEAIKAIKQAFDENDLTIPFPIRTLDFGIKGGQTLTEMIPQTMRSHGSMKP